LGGVAPVVWASAGAPRQNKANAMAVGRVGTECTCGDFLLFFKLGMYSNR